MSDKTKVIDFSEANCLMCDPFDGDYGGSGIADGVLFDKFVKAAKDHVGKCHLCCGDIEKGQRHRSRSEVYDGEMLSFRWCPECCSVMAELIDPKDCDAAQDAWDAREDIGQKRRFSLREAPE